MRLPYRRGELMWVAAAATVSVLLWRFSDTSLGWLERLPLYFFLAATLVLLAMPWLRQRFGDGRDRVDVDDAGIRRTGAAGAREHIGWEDLAVVAVVAGGEDRVTEPPYWLFLDISERGGCAVPADAEGIDALLRRVRALPGFDRGLEARALAADNQQRFVLWRDRQVQGRAQRHRR